MTPQEVAVENVGPVDDGTESLGDVPSLSEEVAGIDNLLPTQVDLFYICYLVFTLLCHFRSCGV